MDEFWNNNIVTFMIYAKIKLHPANIVDSSTTHILYMKHIVLKLYSTFEV